MMDKKEWTDFLNKELDLLSTSWLKGFPTYKSIKESTCLCGLKEYHVRRLFC